MVEQQAVNLKVAGSYPAFPAIFMPFKDKEKQKKFQREWMQKRREEFFANKFCEDCGSKEDLVPYNAKSNKKKFSFSYSINELNEKFKGFSILCDNCYNVRNKERIAKRKTTHGESNRGKGGTYMSWTSMISRCYNKSRDNYRYYGGRGIEVCERWHNYENFLADMGPRPPSMTLDRINPNLNYEPTNCRWADAKTQGMNKRKRNNV